ncbi:MAG: hypothetical protein HY645_10030 [Acidobacteria bacterium]|nr:hypothetical protein [Acidobacteriota bacterium]
MKIRAGFTKLLCLGLLAALSASAQATTYSQLALGGGYECVLIISNETTSKWQGAATLRRGNDLPWSTSWALNGKDATGSTVFDITLDPTATAKFVLRGDATARAGYLVILGKTGFSAVDITVSFFYNLINSSGALLDSTGVPAGTAATQFSFPVEKTTIVNTGFAYASAGVTKSFPIYAVLFDARGLPTAQKSWTYQGHLAQFFTELFADIPDGFMGVVQLVSEQNIFLTVLRLEFTAGGFQLTSVPADVPPKPLPGAPEALTPRFIDSVYKEAAGGTSGFFKSRQNADILLSGVDFNNSGGPLLFNHPGGIASDGTRLLLADTFNNRVLIWHTVPQDNLPPDLVLGQKNFTGNNSGVGRDQMNWPIQVATDGRRIVVADTNNDRILIWNSFPTQNGVPADLVLLGRRGMIPREVTKIQFWWPWGVWTDGQKLVVTSTRGPGILIWNQFPTQDNQPADILLRGGGKMGTPRHITSDGRSLIVGDHDARVEGQGEGGSFFWKTFPTADDQPFDFFMNDPADPAGPTWLRGGFTKDGKLILLGATLHIWNSFPENANKKPDLSLSLAYWSHVERAGDTGHLAVAGARVYISSGNGNKIGVYNSIPTETYHVPDFAVGSPDIYTNTLEAHCMITNPQPVSDGKSLFVASDFNRKLYVWKALPDESGACPNFVYRLPLQPLHIALWKDILALAGSGNPAILIWKGLPRNGEFPDLTLGRRIGSLQLQQPTGVAMDDRYFYIADLQANKVYVWEGIPSENSETAFALDVNGPGRLSSDGNYLTVASTFTQSILLYPLPGLNPNTRPTTIGGGGIFNLPGGAAAHQGHLFIADTGANRVHVWRNIQDALSGKNADLVLGQGTPGPFTADIPDPEIGQNKLFLPGTVFFDGSYLWVGELKFSGRLLRFSPSP